MRLLALNGSPRGARSNTDVLLAPFLAGFAETAGNAHEVLHLVRTGERSRQLAAFALADAVLLAFPLYTDAMPALVADFVASLAPRCGAPGNPPLLFLVQSGFPEPFHSRPVERWAEKLARRLGAPYLGTMVKGGVEGIQARPPWAARSLLDRMNALGRAFGATGRLDPELVARLAGRERLSAPALAGCLLAGALGLLDLWWDQQLRKNGAYDERHARPLL
jgi:NAD(P)H-dependent FMN reductase